MNYILKSPAELVRTAIATCEAPDRLRTTIHLLPALNELCENLARMLCDIIPTRDGNEPLLHASLREAWKQLRLVETQDGDVLQRITAFAQGLTSRLDELNEVRVYVQKGAGAIPWKPSPETLYEFLKRYPGATPLIAQESYAAVDSHTCRQMIAARVIDMAQIQAMGGSLDQIIGPRASAA